MHPYPGNWVPIGCTVVYYAQTAHAFSAGIKCLHCMQRILQKRSFCILLLQNIREVYHQITLITHTGGPALYLNDNTAKEIRMSLWQNLERLSIMSLADIKSHLFSAQELT